jgi:homoserine acetyltransferase
MTTGVLEPAAHLGTVQQQNSSIPDFRLQNGTVMPEVTIAYEAYGRLS